MRLDYSIPDHHQKVFETISEQARKLGQPVYVVGGYVRDYYLERLKEEPDIDLVTIGSGITLAEKLQVQQEELRSANEELEQQTQVLKASEASAALLRACSVL